MPNDPLTYFAVVHDNLGYALDAYPEERASCLREFGKRIIGEYRSVAEAFAAIELALKITSAYRRPLLVRAARVPRVSCWP